MLLLSRMRIRILGRPNPGRSLGVAHFVRAALVATTSGCSDYSQGYFP